MLNKNSPTIIPIDNCPSNSVCATMTGLVRKDEYIKLFSDPIDKICKEHGEIRVLINFDENFQGWDPEAADASWRSILEHSQKAVKVAYVNPPDKRILLHKLHGILFPGEVKFFNKGELDQALKWIAE